MSPEANDEDHQPLSQIELHARPGVQHHDPEQMLDDLQEAIPELADCRLDGRLPQIVLEGPTPALEEAICWLSEQQIVASIEAGRALDRLEDAA